MAKKRIPSKKTLTENISHIRAMIRRVKAFAMKAPPSTMPTPVVKRYGSRLIIDGKTYTPAMLEALRGKGVDWQLPVLAALEEMLAHEQYRRIRLYGSKGIKKVEGLTVTEKSHAEEGLEQITDFELLSFRDWLNSGNSPAMRKNIYYHLYGADSVNRADVREFFRWVEMYTGIVIKNYEDLDKVIESYQF